MTWPPAAARSCSSATSPRYERQRRIRFVHEVEPCLVDARAEDLQEALAMAELMELLGPMAPILLQVGVQTVHGVRSEEVHPRRIPRTSLGHKCRRSRVRSRVSNLALAEPPWGLSPHASAITSTTVDLPAPFSPASTVMPVLRSRPSASICATAHVAGHCDVSTSLPP